MDAEPKDYDGGQLRHGKEDTFPLLTGHAAVVLVRLEPETYDEQFDAR